MPAWMHTSILDELDGMLPHICTLQQYPSCVVIADFSCMQELESLEAAPATSNADQTNFSLAIPDEQAPLLSGTVHKAALSPGKAGQVSRQQASSARPLHSALQQSHDSPPLQGRCTGQPLPQYATQPMLPIYQHYHHHQQQQQQHQLPTLYREKLAEGRTHIADSQQQHEHDVHSSLAQLHQADFSTGSAAFHKAGSAQQEAAMPGQQDGRALQQQGASALQQQGQGASALQQQDGSALQQQGQGASALQQQDGSALQQQDGSALQQQDGSTLHRQDSSALQPQDGSALQGQAVATVQGLSCQRPDGKLLFQDVSFAVHPGGPPFFILHWSSFHSTACFSVYGLFESMAA